MANKIEHIRNDDGTSCLCIRFGHREVLFDEEDRYIVEPLSWSIGTHGYATCGAGQEQVLLHRLLAAPTAGVTVDHINRNKLDNRRSNLRLCTQSENSYNRTAQANNRSGYRGVCRLANGRWYAQICKNSKPIALGCYATAEEAANAYDSAAAIIAGEFAWRNLPDVPLRPNIFEELESKRRKGQMSDEEISDIRALIDMGLTQNEIARRSGRSVDTVRRVAQDPCYHKRTWIRNRKTVERTKRIGCRHPRWLPHATVSLIRNLINEGYGTKEIAQRIGCSVSAIQRIKSGETYKE